MWYCRQSVVLVTATILINRHLQHSLLRVPFKALKTSHKSVNNVYGNRSKLITLKKALAYVHNLVSKSCRIRL